MPNQPIVYADDPEQVERREDESIGWTWCLLYNFLSYLKYLIIAELVLLDMVHPAQFTSFVMIFLFITPLLKSGSTISTTRALTLNFFCGCQ